MPSASAEGISPSWRGGNVVIVTGPDMLLTRAEVAEVAQVSRERVRGWERAGHLDRAGLNESGRPVYKALDAAKVAHKLEGHTRLAAA